MSILLHEKIFLSSFFTNQIFISTSNLKIAIIEYNFKSTYKFSNDKFF